MKSGTSFGFYSTLGNAWIVQNWSSPISPNQKHAKHSANGSMVVRISSKNQSYESPNGLTNKIRSPGTSVTKKSPTNMYPVNLSTSLSFNTNTNNNQMTYHNSRMHELRQKMKIITKNQSRIQDNFQYYCWQQNIARSSVYSIITILNFLIITLIILTHMRGRHVGNKTSMKSCDKLSTFRQSLNR
jgi:hypothetical protein